MKRTLVLLVVSLMCAAAAHADFVILRDGRSYSGVYTGAATGKIAFTDTTGIQYTFPVSQVQSLVFSNVSDHIALRNGQSYTGHLAGITSITFRGSNGVGYVFPLNDVSSLVITASNAGTSSAPASSAISSAYGAASASAPISSAYGAASAMASQHGHVAAAPATASMPRTMAQGTPSVVIPSGTQIVVRTDTAIDTATDAVGKLYPAVIEQGVMDSTGSVGIPSGTQAELTIVNLNQDTTAKNPDLALDLNSVTLNGVVYRVDTSSVNTNGSAGYGMNKRTAIYTGGGAGLGTVMGAIFGGGKGAGIGALAGGGLGAITQYLTRGKHVQVPAESTLTFKLQSTLILHP